MELVIIISICLIWGFIRYNPNLDLIKIENVSYFILWYNNHQKKETKREYIILFKIKQYEK